MLAGSRHFRTSVIVTAQHRAMLDDVLSLFSIRPSHDLNIMRPSQTLYDIVNRSLARLYRILRGERPDMVLVHGDTTTALVAGLAAAYTEVPVGHVEAGLRSYDRENPFPEELNRTLIDHLSSLHFAPTWHNYRCLVREHIAPDSIIVTGNTVIDALYHVLRHTRPQPNPYIAGNLTEPYFVLTVHRRENRGIALRNICRAVKAISRLYPGFRWVIPVHPCPDIRKPLVRYLGHMQSIIMTKPLSYFSFVHLLNSSYAVFTDSGGVQEEAAALNKPVIVLRRKTERPELLKQGFARLAGTEESGIVYAAKQLIRKPGKIRRSPYGDGKASLRIRQALIHHFGISGKKPAHYR